MSLRGCVTAVLAVSVVMATPAPVKEEIKPEEPRSEHGYPCFDGHKEYSHGEVFSLGSERCIKYKCNDGSYDLFEEGCDEWGQCWPVDREFNYKCQNFTCEASFVVGGLKTYQVRPLSTKQCQDRFNNCKRPGEVFEYVMDGKEKKRCSCLPVEGMATSYFCYD